jgi:hypothetical protein
LYGFTSYYRSPADLGVDERRAVETLNGATPELPTAGDATHDQAALSAAFQVLLHSADAGARGVALDQHRYAQAQGRWGLTNPLREYDAEVRTEARALLAVPLQPTATPDEQTTVILGWCSAMGVLGYLGEIGDLPRLMAILDTAVPGIPRAGDVNIELFSAIEFCLLAADEPACRQAGARLAAVAADESLPADLRISALGPFGDDRINGRLDQENVLAELLADRLIKVSIAAAGTLVRRRDHEPLVRRIVAGWPADAPYPAMEVRVVLDEFDELTRARVALAESVDLTNLSDALESVREFGDSTDLPRLSTLLEVADLAGTEEAELLIHAIGRCLPEADRQLRRRTGARLAAIFADARRPTDVRVAAIRVFDAATTDLGQEDALAGLLDHDEPHLSVAAAYALVHLPGYHPRLREVAADWPADAPYPAEEVHEHLGLP